MLEYTKLSKWLNGICTRMLTPKVHGYRIIRQLIQPYEFHNMILCNIIHKIVTNQLEKL